VLVNAFLPGLEKGADGLSKFMKHANEDGALTKFAAHAEHAATDGISRITSAAHTAAPALGMLKSAVGTIGIAPLAAAFAGFKGGGAIAADIGGMAKKFSVARAAGQGFGRGLVGMAGGANIAAAGIALLAGGLVYLSGRESDADAAARGLRDAILGVAAAESGSKDATRGLQDARDRQKDATLGVERAERDYAAAVKNSGRKSLDAREAHQRLSEAKKEQKRADEDLKAAGVKAGGAQDDQRTSNAKLAKSIDDVTKTSQAAASHLLQVAGARDKVAQSGKGIAAQAAIVNTAARAFDKVASSASGAPGPVRTVAAAIAAYIRKTHEIPNSKTTRIILEGAADASSTIAAIASNLAHLHDKTVVLQIIQDTVLNPGKGRPAPVPTTPHGKPKKRAASGGVGANGRVFGGRGGDSVYAMIAPGEDVVNPMERRLMKSGMDYDAAMKMGGAIHLAKGGHHKAARQPRSIEQFLGNSVLNSLSKANSTLGTGDDRKAATRAVNRIKYVLGHGHKFHLMGAEKRELWDALGQYRQQALAPDRSADDFLRASTKRALAIANSTPNNSADDQAAATLAVRDLEGALRKKGLSADEVNSIYDALGGYRGTAQGSQSSSGPDQFAEQHAHDEGVREGLGRLVSNILGGPGDIGTGQGGTALGSAASLHVDKLVLAPTVGNTKTIAQANNAGADTLYRGRTAPSRLRVG
jgi:hypothetical protein